MLKQSPVTGRGPREDPPHLYVGHKSDVLAMEERCAKDPQYSEVLLHDLAMSARLCRVGTLIDFFIHDYASQALAYLYRQRDDQASASASASAQHVSKRPDLSENEYGRLQRAFLTFELYRRCFDSFDEYGWRQDSSEFYSSYVYVTHIHEFGELWSVSEYLAVRMHRASEKMKEAAICRLHKTKAAAAEAETNVQEKIEKTEKEKAKKNDKAESNHYPSSNSGYNIDDLPDMKQSIELDLRGKLTFLVELGLPFCKRFLFHMDIKKQAAATLLLSGRPPMPYRPIICRLSHLARNDVREYNPTGVLRPDPLNKGRPSDASVNFPRSCHQFRLHSYGCRQIGFWFWDDDRMKDFYYHKRRLGGMYVKLHPRLLPRRDEKSKRVVQKQKIAFDLGIRSGEDVCLAVLFGRLSADGEGTRFNDAELCKEIEGLDYDAYI